MNLLRKILFVITLLVSLQVNLRTLHADLIVGSTIFDFSPNPSVSLGLSINTDSNTADIFMSGRSDGWFAIGFGSTTMANTYAIVVENTGNVDEYQLQQFGFGNILLTDQITVVSNEVTGMDRTVHLQRALDVGQPGYYVFPTIASTVNLAGASGPGPFGYHLSRSAGSITLTAVPEPSSLAFAMLCLTYLTSYRSGGYWRRSNSSNM